MAYDWTQITNELITNLFLYGQTDTPTDLVSEQWIRPKDDPTIPNDYVDYIHIDVEMTGFMTDGPGRYAALSPLVQAFMHYSPIAGETHLNGEAYEFTADDLYVALMAKDGVNATQGKHTNFSIHQTSYLDATTNLISKMLQPSEAKHRNAARWQSRPQASASVTCPAGIVG